MAYKTTAPADDEFLADFPAEQREQHRAIVNDKIVNAGKLNGLTSGNASGNIPISNGTKNTNLNADLLDGHDSTYFAPATHTHDAATTSSNGLMSNTDKTKLNGIATGAEVNQNAFANMKVGSTTIQADAKQDTLELEAGSNISLTPDATNDKVTIGATGLLPLSGGTLTGNTTLKKANPRFIIQTTGATRGTAPSAAVNDVHIYGYDNASKALWGLYSRYGTDKSNRVDLIAYKGTTTDSIWSGIGIGYDGSGNWFTSAPTPAANSNNTNIATTAFVNTRLQSTITSTNAKPLRVTTTYNDSSGTTYTSDCITVNTSNSNYGNNVAFGGGGNTIVGGGESYSAQLAALEGNSGENCYICADGTVYIKPNCNTFANAKEFSFKADGTSSFPGTISVNGTAVSLSNHTHSYLPLSGGTISGNIAKSTNVTKGTNPSATTWLLSNIVFDKGGTATANRLSEYRAFVESNGRVGTEMLSYDYTSGATAYGILGIYKPLNAAGYAYTNSQFRIDKANTSAGGGLRLVGAGQNFAISISNTNVTKGTAPSAIQYVGIDFYGKDMSSYNQRTGMIEHSINTANLSSTYLRAYNCTTNTNTATSSIGVHVDGSGNAYTSAPTPAATDNSTKIATTAFVKNFVGTGGGISASSIAQNGYVKFANGLIIQWGKKTASTFNFPITFPNAVYGAWDICDTSNWSRIQVLTTSSVTFSTNSGYAFAIGY